MSNEALAKAEDVADHVLRRSKHILPHAAHLCLVATFLEDGIRMFVQWEEQRDYIEQTWGCGSFLSILFVIINLFGQLCGCVMVMLRQKVEIAVGMLFLVIGLQTLAYSVLWNLHFFLRNLALSGGLLLLLAETRDEGKSMFAGVPTVGGNKSRTYMQLTGRMLLVLMFLTVFSFDDTSHIILFCIGLVLVVMVAIGFKAKLSALVLVLILTLGNLLINDFWNLPSDSPLRDFVKYDFFQLFSVIGGLLLVVAYGPGGVSFDEHKKMW